MDGQKKVEIGPSIHINPALKKIIIHQSNSFVEDREFERRFPRDDLNRDRKCRFRPKSTQNEELLQILQSIGIQLEKYS